MKIVEPLIALGMWAVLGIAADSTGATGTEMLSVTEVTDTEPWSNVTDIESYGTEEWETESESKMETEEMTEYQTEERRIVISGIKVKDTERYYDGTTDVELEGEVTGLPREMELQLLGHAEKADAGVWKVEAEAVLKGEDSDNCQVELEETSLQIQIKPRPLQIRISNARKCYYSENSISSLVFEEEEPIEITGFLECDQKEKGMPEGFEYPELEINEAVLQKDSPMFEKGAEIRYQHAVTLKKDKDGKVTGNPTANYTFNIEETEDYDGGDVILSAAPISGTLDYTIHCSDSDALKMDEHGNIWIRNGESLIITPTENSGFTEGKTISGINGDGVEEFVLIRRNQAGEIIAESQIRSISWFGDGEAPSGIWMLDGTQWKEGTISYRNCDTQIAYAYLQDRGSGVKKTELYVAYGEETEADGESLYREKKSGWRETGRLLLDRQGTCRVWARTEDQVGNIVFYASGEIVLDRTAPEIWFDNLQAGSANKGAVEPVCQVRDEYLQTDSLKITVTGSSGEERQVSWNRQETENEKELQVKMKNLPIEREWDDVYTLKAEAKDLAGNCSSREMVFSVNRFGSVYYLGEETRKMTDQFYISSPKDVKVYEVNVDYLTESGILLGYEGETRQLKKGLDYTVKKTGNDKTWKEYCYTISADCFEKEGLYYLICASEDRALNTSDNRMRKQKLEFAVDKSEPDILLTGIENEGIYQEPGKIVNLECRDNLALKEVTVWINGKEVLQNEKEEQQMELQEGDGWQSIRVMAVDKAGNTADTGELYYWIGTTEVTPLKKTEAGIQTGKIIARSEKNETEQIEEQKEKRKNVSSGKQKSQVEKNWKVLGAIAVIAVLWAIFLKAKREK